MESNIIETGADYPLLNSAREELSRVWNDVRWSREPQSNDEQTRMQEAKSLGEVGEAFRNAEEAVFNAINIASSHQDPKALDAIATLSGGLTAIGQSQSDRQRV